MTKSKKSRKSKKNFKDKVFKATGMTLNRLVFVCIAVVGIIAVTTYIVLIEDSGSTRSSSREVAATALDDAADRLEKQSFERPYGDIYREASSVPAGFDNLNTLKKITLLDAKVKLCRTLVDSDSDYVEEAKDRLIRIYGLRMSLENKEGIDSSNSSENLEQLRSQAVKAGNQKRVDLANFVLAYGRIQKLGTENTREDFRLAAEAIKRIDGKSLRNNQLVLQIYSAATELFDNLPRKEDATELLKFLGSKFSQSPDANVAKLGLELKDYPFFTQYLTKMRSSIFDSRDKRFALFRELFTQIEKTPPAGLNTYRETIVFLDQLLNKTDHEYVGVLLDKLSIAADHTSPAYKEKIKGSIAKIRQRSESIGTVAELSGKRLDGSDLGLPNGKKTVLVFWRSNDAASIKLFKSLTTSNRFDIWTTNIAFASDVQPTDRDRKTLDTKMSKFILLDRPTSKSLMGKLGVDQVPYVVELSQDGTVIKMSADLY